MDIKQDILNRLKIIDSKILLLNLSEKINFIVFGGAWFVLKVNSTDMTYDIDMFDGNKDNRTLKTKKAIKDILNELNSNDEGLGLSKPLMLIEKSWGKHSDEYKDNDQFTSIRLFFPKNYLIALSKLFRNDQKDIRDLSNELFMKEIDLQKMNQIFDDELYNAIAPSERSEFSSRVTKYEEKVKEWRKNI